VQLIANTRDTKIPGTNIVFGSVAPPSAAQGQAVFAGFDNEIRPSAGGIYHVNRLTPSPKLNTLVAIGSQVPDEAKGVTFNFLGEGVSFDGRLVAFWGAWGSATRTVTLYCPTEGNKDRILFCQTLYPFGFAVQVPLRQGVFIHDVITGQTRTVAKTGADFMDFLYWNFSGKVPGVGEGDDDGEPARWRSASFVGVTSNGATSRAVFKAVRNNGTSGLYAAFHPGNHPIVTLIDTTTKGQTIDPEAPFGSKVTEVGLEREGLRNDSLAVNVSMAIPGLSEEAGGWAGIYLTNLPQVPEPVTGK
jgi:hypothetical protein